jgi:hypothetical protein
VVNHNGALPTAALHFIVLKYRRQGGGGGGGVIMTEHLRIAIAFDGRTASNGVIDFYDAQRALSGFQRTLALATHLAINGEIITQAPSLKGADILALAAEQGSWKFTAVVASGLASGIYTAGTAPADTPLGHLVSSIYDYTLHKTMGIELDYQKTIRQMLQERGVDASSIPTPEQLSSIAEKSQNSVIDMHRPIDRGTAATAELRAIKGDRLYKVGPTMNRNTLDAARHRDQGDELRTFVGRISSYNMNTHTGRIYLPELARTIPFEISRDSISKTIERAISQSLDRNIAGLPSEESNINMEGIYYLTKTGDISKIIATNVTIFESN